MRYKKIWKEDRYVLSEDVLIYEVKTGLSKVGKLQRQYYRVYPTFENRFWEVYALHRLDGLYYAIIGKHHGVRVFYKKDIYYSRMGQFYMPIGRDLAVRLLGYSHWDILSYVGDRIIRNTRYFLKSPLTLITDIKYSSPVISMVQKSHNHGNPYEAKIYWKQGKKGYTRIEAEDVQQTVLECASLPEDPWYV